MSIVSLHRTEDLELLAILAEIIEVTYKIYQKEHKDEVRQALEASIAAFELVKKGLDTKDYKALDDKWITWQQGLALLPVKC